jgi:hypothetical protein
MLTLRLTIFVAVFLAIANPAGAQITPSKESLSDIYPGKAYSPYAQRNFPDQVFWGDTHLHTGLSVDAGLFGARLGLDEAYRFARGEQVMASSGQPRPRWDGLSTGLSSPITQTRWVSSMISRQVTRTSSNLIRRSPGTKACNKAARPRLRLRLI